MNDLAAHRNIIKQPYVLTRAELTDFLVAKIALPRAAARGVAETTLETICAALERGENVKLSGFGQFTLRNKTARIGRNPKTDQIVPIAPRRVVSFKASPKLKGRVETGNPTA